MPQLQVYFKHIRKHSFPFPCPHCKLVLSPEEFETHCSVQHQLVDACVWCLGNTVWFRGQPDVHHLLQCFQKFSKSRDAAAAQTLAYPISDAPTLLDTTTPMTVAETYFHREPVLEVPATPIWPPKLGAPTVPYRDASLNAAVSCLHLYLGTRKETEWYHVMIRPAAFPGFLRALDDGQSCTMPFYCYCDGGDRKSFHRHLILASRHKNQFARKVWKKIDCPKKNLQIRKQAIESPMQLVNLLGHFSQRRSKCAFSFEDPLDARGATDRHFYVALSLPPLYRVVLAAQWDGGLLELVNQEYGVVDPSLLVAPAERFNGIWGIRIRNLPGIATNIVLPVQKNYRPVAEPTEKFVCLIKDRKLYFEEAEGEGEGEPDEDAWVRDQAERGNVFFGCIGDEVWYPTPEQQKFINSAKPLSDRIANLMSELSRVNDESIHYKSDKEYLMDENVSLKRRVEESEDELKRLQKKHIKLLERENDILKLELKNKK